jgi:hypothetical protein
VAKAGYSIAEELPILLLIFGLPDAAAIIVYWKLLQPAHCLKASGISGTLAGRFAIACRSSFDGRLS